MKEKKNGSIAIAAVAAILVLVAVIFRSAAPEAAYPIERGVRLFSRKVSSRIKGAFNGAAAAAENRQLKRELAALALLRTDLDRLEAENVRLRKLLDYTAREPENWIVAEVLSQGGGAVTNPRYVRVAKGSCDGIRRGAVVLSADGLAGIVDSVSPHTADVLTIADTSINVSCYFEANGETKPTGIVCGGTDDRLEVKHLLGRDSLLPHTRALTTGLGGIFPKDILIGRWTGDAIEPSVDWQTLEDVFIRREN